jgi:hypothetical protein
MRFAELLSLSTPKYQHLMIVFGLGKKNKWKISSPDSYRDVLEKNGTLAQLV